MKRKDIWNKNDGNESHDKKLGLKCTLIFFKINNTKITHCLNLKTLCKDFLEV